jgi:hypothetical protein
MNKKAIILWEFKLKWIKVINPIPTFHLPISEFLSETRFLTWLNEINLMISMEIY